MCSLPTVETPFVPHPWLRNRHVQTIFPAYAWHGSPRPSSARRIVQVSDGDQLVLHEDETPVGDRIAVLLHGLNGSAQSPYMLRIAAKLRECGFHVVRVDLRGHGNGMALARKPGHAGRSGDVAAVLQYLSDRYPKAKFDLVGISLGGNLVLKLLGEPTDESRAARQLVRSAVVACPPIDLVASSKHMLQPQCRLYSRAFVKKLIYLLQQQSDQGEEIPLPSPLPRTVWDFDNRFTAPLSGFRDAMDYYLQSSASRVLEHVSTPTLLLASQDDPIVPAAMFQRDFPPSISLCLSKHGGHVGFYAARNGDPDRYWMDWRVVDWLSRNW
jgi:predicted alpha/beta-fold hydrolase